MTGVGLESTVLPTFVVAVALILAYSALFVRLNRDRLLISLLATSAWCLAGLFVLVVASTDSAHYWAVALGILSLISGAGTLSSLVHRRALKVRVRADALRNP